LFGVKRRRDFLSQLESDARGQLHGRIFSLFIDVDSFHGKGIAASISGKSSDTATMRRTANYTIRNRLTLADDHDSIRIDREFSGDQGATS
jgi:hypothetical protein